MKTYLIKYIISLASTDYTPEECYAIAKAETYAGAVEQIMSDCGEDHIDNICVDIVDPEDCHTVGIGKTLYDELRHYYGLEELYGKDN